VKFGKKYMSKIGKKPITIPSGVEVSVEDGFVSAKGPKGTLKKPIPAHVNISVTGNILSVQPQENAGRGGSVLWGLTRALVQNMVIGVSEGFEKILEFQGVGYKANIKGSDIELSLGLSHPVLVHGPEGIIFKTEKNTIHIHGIDKELIGEVAAKIRSYRPPEPYKGSGIHYLGEHIRRKAGKKAATAG
jgi:large subunit ribosomal protein L6